MANVELTQAEKASIFNGMVLSLEKAMWDSLIDDNGDDAFRDCIKALCAIRNGVLSGDVLIGDNDYDGTIEWLDDCITSGMRTFAHS